MKYSLCLIISLLFNGSLWSQNGDLTIVIDGFHTSKGECLITLFNSKAGYPMTAEKAYKSISHNISNEKCVVVFSSIPKGNYAVSVLHDENSNRKLDVNFFGKPKEGIGASNNAKGTFGPPSFKDAAVPFVGTNESINIRMRYF